MKVLIVGGGGREHALCWALGRSAAAMFCAPGNAGTAALATNLPLSIDDHAALADAAKRHAVDLVVVGPEVPLAAGLVDHLMGSGIKAFGPTAAAARIEASKAFAKEVMERAGVPSARCATFTDLQPALRYLKSHPEPLVVKASGLAAGKGAVVCRTRAEAVSAAREMFGGKFGDAGRAVLVEEFLEGEELSVFVLTDGERWVLLPPAQDHKRLGEGDEGPNTGGMGAYTPVSLATSALLGRVEDEVLRPVLREMAARGAPYRGLLYAGLMIAPDETPNVLEFNCRFGDPETQAVLPSLDDDLLEDLWRIAAGEAWRPQAARLAPARAAVTTVLAARGYPETPETGAGVTVPSTLPSNTVLFHAGTTRDSAGTVRVAGGRVLNATGLGPTVAEAATASRHLASLVRFEGSVYRRDIGWREVARAGAA